jgi:hypothetical protein
MVNSDKHRHKFVLAEYHPFSSPNKAYSVWVCECGKKKEVVHV